MHLKRRTDGVLFDLVAMAYVDGIAYRMVVPPQPGIKTLDVYWETTGFYLPADYDCRGANAGVHVNSHEFEFDPIKASRMRNFRLYDAPLVCRTDHGSARSSSPKRTSIVMLEPICGAVRTVGLALMSV